jgi:hypothetical protein
MHGVLLIVIYNLILYSHIRKDNRVKTIHRNNRLHDVRAGIAYVRGIP